MKIIISYIHKNSLKLNGITEIIELLEENISMNPHEFKLGNEISDMTPKL